MTTLGGKSSFPESHPLSLGSGGIGIGEHLWHFLNAADTIFGIGCSFTRTSFGTGMPKGKKIIHATLAATRAFDGCHGVTVLADNADPTHVVLLETWESLEHDQAYRVWRTTPEGASDLGSILAAAPKLSLYTEAEGV